MDGRHSVGLDGPADDGAAFLSSSHQLRQGGFPSSFSTDTFHYLDVFAQPLTQTLSPKGRGEKPYFFLPLSPLAGKVELIEAGGIMTFLSPLAGEGVPTSRSECGVVKCVIEFMKRPA